MIFLAKRVAESCSDKKGKKVYCFSMPPGLFSFEYNHVGQLPKVAVRPDVERVRVGDEMHYVKFDFLYIGGSKISYRKPRKTLFSVRRIKNLGLPALIPPQSPLPLQVRGRYGCRCSVRLRGR